MSRDDDHRRPVRRLLWARTILRAAGWSAASVATLIAIGIASSRPIGHDTALYLAWAHQLLGGEALYSLAAPYAGDNMYYPYTPVTPILFIPLASFPAEVASALWTAGLVLLAATIAYALIRPLSADLKPWAVVAFALFTPLSAEIILGNLNLVTLALCLLAWHLRERPAWSGAALALAVGLKLMPLALPIFFIAAGAWRSVAWAAGLGGAAIVASVMVQSADWAAYLSLILDIPYAVGTKTPIAPTGPVSQAVRLMVTVAVTTVAGRLARDPERADTSYALALAAIPFAPPLIVYNYLVFAIPLMATLLRGGPTWWWPGVAVSFLAMNVPTRSGAPIVAFAGLTLLLVLGLVAAASGASSTAARGIPRRDRKSVV